MYEFGPFRLDTGQRVLHRDGQLVSVPPKALDTLFVLVKGEGKVIGKEELLRKVWPETFVEEGNLTQNISILRKALGEGTNGQQYIETIPKRGYRFVAPVIIRSEPNVHAPELLPGAAIRPGRQRVLGVATGLVLAVGGIYMAAQYPKSKPLTDHDVLVLADFTNSTGDPVFDATLRDALAFQLEQSPFLKVLDDGVVREDLELMRRSPQEHITNDLAREICVREAKKAMLGGSIASLGRSYALDLKATNCQSGAILAREHADAVDKEHVLSALAKAAQGMRARLGESLTSIEKLAPPAAAWRVTTGSVEAFQAFRSGAQFYTQGRLSEAVPVLQHATELDPDLALAWVWLAVGYQNSGGDKKLVHEYNERAWALRDRVSAYERLWIASSRRGQTTGQYINEFEDWARTYPRDVMPVIALGRVHAAAGEFEEALAEFQSAYRIEHRRAIHVIDLAKMYTRLDRFDEAKAVAETMFAQGEDAPMLHRQLLAIAYKQGDQTAAAKQLEWFAGKPEEYLSLADQALEARVRGELRRSRQSLDHAAHLARRRNLLDAAAGFLKPDADRDALVGNCETARKTGAASDAALALCGNQALADRAEEMNKGWIGGYLSNPAKVPLTRAAEALGLGRPGAAIEQLESVAPYERAYPMSNYIRGLAFLRVRRGQDAAAEFQKILDHRGANWGPLYPLSYVGLARGAALAGNAARARTAYQRFFELWKDADRDVPVLIQARKEFARLGD